MKYICNNTFDLLNHVFEKGDEIFLSGTSYRDPGITIDWHKVFDGNKNLLGSITSDKYWKIKQSEYYVIDSVTIRTDNTQVIIEAQKRIEALQKELLEYKGMLAESVEANVQLKNENEKLSSTLAFNEHKNIQLKGGYEKLRDLCLLLEEYNTLLGNEISDMAIIADVHHWKSKNVDAGERLRGMIMTAKAGLSTSREGK